jgi:hypothetical protein
MMVRQSRASWQHIWPIRHSATVVTPRTDIVASSPVQIEMPSRPPGPERPHPTGPSSDAALHAHQQPPSMNDDPSLVDV